MVIESNLEMLYNIFCQGNIFYYIDKNIKDDIIRNIEQVFCFEKEVYMNNIFEKLKEDLENNEFKDVDITFDGKYSQANITLNNDWLVCHDNYIEILDDDAEVYLRNGEWEYNEEEDSYTLVDNDEMLTLNIRRES